MYLTRLTLNPQNPLARRDLGSANEMHRTLVRAFVQDKDSHPARFLWRLEAGKLRWDRPTVLIQSTESGNWPVLKNLPGYLQTSGGIATKHIDLEVLVQPRRRYRFRLLANPTICRQGKRLALVGQQDQLAWLERKGMQHGFMVLSPLIAGRDRWLGGKIAIERVCFEGLLEPREPGDLRKTLVAGIGPAKAYGCGLLSLAPCR